MVRRLPWSEELPRLWMATMRPKPVMIPVNMPPFSQGIGRPRDEARKGPEKIPLNP
jgi:hypothetical protein